MSNYDFGSTIPDDLPITKRVAAEIRTAAQSNTGINGFKLPGMFAQSLLNGLADLENRLNALEAGKVDG
ncbi:hypothetical protein F1734_17520 [Rhodococcus ruber]|uniref:hypothetical protein n=1 Tax=Rhodococcus ruber TaxID=1830 RepID=UPI001933F822|nr:hypothetical protein [Rhodococcus ruber]QRE81866.1 hypothetical protein F1734_17520 [Rhodococcus ruber]